jgi:hypothetical protein
MNDEDAIRIEEFGQFKKEIRPGRGSVSFTMTFINSNLLMAPLERNLKT